MNSVMSFWGSGRGPLRSLQPQIRIISGFLAGCACLAVPLRSPAGIAVVVLTAVCWSALAGMPAKTVMRCALASLVLFFPFLLLTPWMDSGASAAAPVAGRCAAAGTLALRSTCCLFVAAATIVALPLCETHRGMARLPLPAALAVLIVQLITQTMLLAEETKGIISALRLRKASGTKGSIRLLFNFPVVWMVRILFRAERTAAAMTVRGFGIEHANRSESVSLTAADVLTAGVACAVFILAILLRLRVIG